MIQYLSSALTRVRQGIRGGASALDYRAKRECIGRNPAIRPLDTAERTCWQSGPERETNREMQGLLDDWNEGARGAARPRIADAEKLDLPLFLSDFSAGEGPLGWCKRANEPWTNQEACPAVGGAIR